MLGEMMRRLGDSFGEIPEPLGRAERAMRDATEALQRRQPGEAIGPQTEALDQLQQAAREFAQQMQRQLGRGNPDDNDVRATDSEAGDRIERVAAAPVQTRTRHHPRDLSATVHHHRVQAVGRFLIVTANRQILLRRRPTGLLQPDDTELVTAVLNRNGFDAELLNGDLPQKERERVMATITAVH